MDATDLIKQLLNFGFAGLLLLVYARWIHPSTLRAFATECAKMRAQFAKAFLRQRRAIRRVERRLDALTSNPHAEP